MKNKKQTHYREEIRRSLIFHALIPIILLTIILIVSISVVGMNNIKKNDMELCNSLSNKIEQTISEYEDKLAEVREGLDIAKFENDSKYRVDMISKIYSFLYEQDIKGEFYIFKNSKLLYTTETQKYSSQYIENYIAWLKNGNDNSDIDDREKMTFIYGTENSLNEDRPYILIRSLLSKDSNLTVIFAIPCNSFDLLNESSSISIAVANKFNRIFYKNNSLIYNDMGKVKEQFRNRTGYLEYNNKYYYVLNKKILNDEARIIICSDVTSFIKFIITMMFVAGVVFIIIVMVIFYSANYIAKEKTIMVEKLVNTLQEVKKGNLDIRLESSENDEFEIISDTCNKMIESMKKLIATHQELAVHNAKSNMKFLESQFNSHFLFNTLEAIRFMMWKDRKTSEKMIIILSKLLRYSIENDDMVILEEEVSAVYNYIKIMQYRFGDRLSFKTKIPEEFLIVKVPRMILQPFIENSMKHGLKEDLQIEIKITVFNDSGNMKITMEDNGSGIDNVLLNEITNNLKSDENEQSHVGIYNANKRMMLTYGEKYAVDIKSKIDIGTIVTLTIPLGRGEKRDVESSYSRG